MKVKKNDFIAALNAYEFWTYLAWQDIRLRYRRSKIGPFWITLSMAIFAVALGLVYSQIFKMKIADYVPFMAIGIVTWNFISLTICEFSSVYVENAPYIKDMKTNLLVIILRVIARNFILFLHNLIIVIGIYLWFKINPGWNFFYVIPGIFAIIIFLFLVGIPLSIVGARFRDVSQIVQSLMQVVFFITPIMWLPRLLPEGSMIVTYNPFSQFIEIIREPLMGVSPSLGAWCLVAVYISIAGLLSILIYRLKANRIAFWV